MPKNNDSLRLQLLRFPLIVGVVFIHAYTLPTDPPTAIASGFHINEFIQTLISQELARCAVPLFFLMSGYLFFSGAAWSTEKYKTKIRSRISTLLIPFLFWNILVLMLFAAAQSHPKTAPFISGKMMPIRDYGIFEYLSAIFWHQPVPSFVSILVYPRPDGPGAAHTVNPRTVEETTCRLADSICRVVVFQLRRKCL